MTAIGFPITLFTILITSLEINGRELQDPIKFDDEDFTDYEEIPLVRTKRETQFSDKPFQVYEYLNSKFEINENKKLEEANTSINTRKEGNLSNNKAPVPLDLVLRRIDKINSGKLKAFRRNKREATFTSLKSIEEEDVEVIFKRIEKLNPEKAKEILHRNKRDISVSGKDTEFLKDDIKIVNEDNIAIKKAGTLREIKYETILSDKINPTLMIDDDSKPKLEIKYFNPKIARILQKSEVATSISSKRKIRGKRESEKEKKHTKEAKQVQEKREAKKGKERSEQAKKLHALKIEEIMDFLENNYLSTNFIYEEMKRIKKEGVVFDKFRRLVRYLERRDQEVLKKSVLKCYYNSIVADKKHGINIWKGRIPNNLIIDPIEDHYNKYV